MNESWEDRLTSTHEAGHAVVARYLGLAVPRATMREVIVPHRPYDTPDDLNTLHRLIIGAAGDAATTCFLCYTGTGEGDLKLARDLLNSLNAGRWKSWRLMRLAKRHAIHTVRQLKQEISVVAAALRTHGTLTQDQLDQAIAGAHDDN